MLAKSFESPTYVFAIDRDDMIQDVGESWADFVRCFFASDESPDLVAGTSLWDYMTEPAARRACHRAIERARQQRCALSMDFHCDAPDICRRMRVELVAGSDGDVYFVSRAFDDEGTQGLRRPDQCRWREEFRDDAPCGWCHLVVREIDADAVN
ncbi:MAG: hypothetical protein H6684_11375 [Deltaproteobacteria bacterium]|nr:hypothetical protein [Deltaproteobacteria bacterium]MCB9478339.1 hypothetical protein [Deltaproteobacteria bacterium]MCB9489323.1 hypothetical protein [Deltaproteobacteria bacterium]